MEISEKIRVEAGIDGEPDADAPRSTSRTTRRRSSSPGSTPRADRRSERNHHRHEEGRRPRPPPPPRCVAPALGPDSAGLVDWTLMPRRFYVRTFGCQMNEHDSERIAGLLADEGMEPTDDARGRRRRRPQHLLHPGERRQQALRAPRAPEVAEGPRARTCRSRSAAAWPRRTGTSSSSGPATSTSCSAPTTSPTRRRCSPSRPARGDAGRRDPRGARGVPVGAAGPPRGRPHAPGSRSRSAATTRARSASCPRVRGAEVSRRMGDIVHEVSDLAARRRGRDHAARPERELLRPRPRRGAVAPAVRRPAARGRRGRRHPPGPVHVAAPEGPTARDRRGDGRVRDAVCEHLHLPLQSGATATLARMRRGYTARALPREARDGARRDPRPRGDHRHHRRLPRRDRRRLRAHARGGRRGAATTRRTRSCSRPGPAPRRPRWSTSSCPPRS